MESGQIDQVIGKKFLKKKSILGEKERETLYIVEECNCEEFSSCKYVLLFFSAGWCPPCEQFLQVLKDFYSEVNIDEKTVEVVYISADKKEQDFKDTYAKMPWLTF
jgi:thiol-disulfide isomerase/thioredoxin